MNKRLIKEIKNLYVQQSLKPNLIDNDYIVHFDEENINKVYALIKAPKESVYKHTFIRLDLDIPDNYPHSPPKVYFKNHDSVRIHPNMYEDGKCCSTILNTWGDSIFEKWTSSMNIETILITFHSFLDNNPYTYEPGGGDDPNYTVYVRYQTWTTCLFRYLQYENIDIFLRFIHNYLLSNVDEIFKDLNELKEEFPNDYYYCRCFEIDNYWIDYGRIINTLSYYYNYLVYTDFTPQEDKIDWEEFRKREYKCSICFDTLCIDNNEIDSLEDTQLHDNINYDKDSIIIKPTNFDFVYNNNNRSFSNFLNEFSDFEDINLIDDLPPEYNEISNEEEIINQDLSIIDINCGHSFHKSCLLHHFSKNHWLCPMCRKEVDKNEFENLINKKYDQQQNEEWIINPLTKRKIKIGSKTWHYLKDNDFI